MLESTESNLTRKLIQQEIDFLDTIGEYKVGPIPIDLDLIGKKLKESILQKFKDKNIEIDKRIIPVKLKQQILKPILKKKEQNLSVINEESSINSDH